MGRYIFFNEAQFDVSKAGPLIWSRSEVFTNATPDVNKNNNETIQQNMEVMSLELDKRERRAKK